MNSLVTSKGQVTIPKELRDRFGIRPGALVDFTPTDSGIRLSKVVDRRQRSKVLGCLKDELKDHTVTELLHDLRGPVELPRRRAKVPRS